MLTLIGATSALAAPAPAPPITCGKTYKVENGHMSYSYDHYDRGPEWRVSAYGPGTLTLTRTVTAANSVSGTFGASIADISASVGFDVTHSTSYAASYAYPMPADPPNVRWTVEAGTRDDVFVYDVQAYDCRGKTVGPAARGQAERTGQLIYHYFGEAPGHP